ncbi:MAG: hypothetical protein IT462_14545 [Planctomycetes bacterium]|nr:hypothetical protein [Planctomycetota bacterium]
MPLPRILFVGLVAMLFAVGILWTMNLNFLGWIGTWFSKDQAYSTGIGITVIAALALGWLYANIPAMNMPSPVRGLLFGLILAAIFIWALPTVLASSAAAAEDARHLSDGSLQKGARIEPSKIPEFPEGMRNPPMNAFTQGKAWENKQDWEGRLAPFLIAFGVYGLILGVFLNDPEAGKKKR